MNPFDIQQQADALYEALTMPADERRRRREAAAEIVRTNDIGKWLEVQIADLRTLTGLWESETDVPSANPPDPDPPA